MKRFFCVVLCTVAFGNSAFTQGLINFLNSPTTLVTLWDYWQANPILGPIPSGNAGQYRFELFTASAGTLTDVGFVSSGLFATNINTAGRIVGVGGNGLAIPGHPLGGTCAILIRGWSAFLGTNYAEAVVNNYAGHFPGFVGSSSIAPNFRLGGDGGAGNVPTSPAFGGFVGIQSGFALYRLQLPEPSSIALVGSGLVSLVIYGHRNRKR